MSVADKIYEIVAERMGVKKEDISEATSFTTDLGADSLDVVELVMEFEEQLKSGGFFSITALCSRLSVNYRQKTQPWPNGG